MAIAADMVKSITDGNTQVITNLANKLGEVEKMQDQAAQGVADWANGLTEQTDQLIKDMEEDVKALNMSKEAEEAG